MGLALVGVLVAWFSVDFGYSRVVDHKLSAWEAGIERDAAGVRDGCQEFTIGDGKTALLFVHGFGDSPQVWSYIAPWFAARGYTCRAILLPGFAHEMSVYETTNRHQWREKIEAELATLRETHESVFIVAHSLGGSCSINLLMEHPDAADGLVAFAPLVAVSNRRSPVLTARTWFKVLDKMQVFTHVIASAYDPNVRNSKELETMRVDRFVPRVVFREMFAVLADNEKRAAELKTPVMMVVTDQDMVVDSKKTAAFFDQIGSPKKELVPHNQAGHVIPRDYDWEVPAEKAHLFIQGILADKQKK